MNSSDDLKVVGEQGVLAKKILTQKEFSFKGLDWQYENNFHLALMDGQFEDKLRIKNHMCEMDGSSIKKVTEVTFKDKKYIIEDIYSLNLLPNGTQFEASQAKESATNDSDNKNDVKQKDEDEHKKVYIFKKDKKRKVSQEKKPFSQLRSTKNIAKNFCKAFLVFLKPDRAAEGSRDEGLRIFTQLIKRQRFNNKMIKAVLKNQVLRDLFREFLLKQAKNWISQSKIRDKAMHEEAIDIYLNLFDRIQMSSAEDNFDSDSSASAGGKSDSEEEESP